MKKISLYLIIGLSFISYNQFYGQISMTTNTISPDAYIIKPDKTIPITNDGIYPEIVSANGKKGLSFFKTGLNATYKIYDLENNIKLFESEKINTPSLATFNNDGTNIKFVIYDRQQKATFIKTFDLIGNELNSIKLPIIGYPYQSKFSPDFTKFLLLMQKDTIVYIINTDNGNVINKFSHSRAKTSTMDFNSFIFATNDKIIFSLKPDKKFKFVSDKNEYKYRKDLENAVAKDPSNKSLLDLITKFDEMASNLVILDVNTGKMEYIINTNLNSIAISPKIVFVDKDILFVKQGKEDYIFKINGGNVSSVFQTLSNGSIGTASSEEGEEGNSFTLTTGTPDLEGPGEPLCVSNDNKYIIMSGGKGINIWDIPNGKKILFMSEDLRVFYQNVHFSTDGIYLIGYIASYNQGGTIGENHISYWNFEELLKKVKN